MDAERLSSPITSIWWVGGPRKNPSLQQLPMEEIVTRLTGEWLGEHDLEAFARGLGSYHARHIEMVE
jgi:hypothetical protein